MPVATTGGRLQPRGTSPTSSAQLPRPRSQVGRLVLRPWPVRIERQDAVVALVAVQLGRQVLGDARERLERRHAHHRMRPTRPVHRGSQHVVRVYVAAGPALYDQIRGRAPLVKDPLCESAHRIDTVAVHRDQRVRVARAKLQPRIVPRQAGRHPPGSSPSTALGVVAGMI